MADNQLMIIALQGDFGNFRVRTLRAFTRLGSSLALFTVALNTLSTWSSGIEKPLSDQPISSYPTLENLRIHPLHAKLWKGRCDEYYESLRYFLFIFNITSH